MPKSLLSSPRPYRKSAATLIALCLAPTMAKPARADFVVDQATHTTPIPYAPGRRVAPAQKPTAAPHHPGYPVVRGFGTGIALREALPMIVPPYVRIRMGAGIDPAMPCSWRGGLPWPATLNAAINPLGLRIVATPTALTIEIQKPSS